MEKGYGYNKMLTRREHLKNLRALRCPCGAKCLIEEKIWNHNGFDIQVRCPNCGYQGKSFIKVYRADILARMRVAQTGIEAARYRKYRQDEIKNPILFHELKCYFENEFFNDFISN